MTKEQIKGYFDRAYNGQKNLMARKIIDYRKKKNVILEMSEVKIDGKSYIGCTFLCLKKNDNGYLVAHRFDSKPAKIVSGKLEAMNLLWDYAQVNE